MANLHTVITWLRENGEVKAIDRLRVALIPDVLSEGIALTSVTPATPCSPALLEKVVDQASAIIGKPCPA